uniref:Uncharacterized protein n=1 Tax=Dromaius novaehollandiae TaxID=8790 RepID=A0A8C4K6P9_DRONO
MILHHSVGEHGAHGSLKGQRGERVVLLFLCILLSFPTLLLYLSHSCPDWIISLCTSICIIIKLVIFFKLFYL